MWRYGIHKSESFMPSTEKDIFLPTEGSEQSSPDFFITKKENLVHETQRVGSLQ